MIRPLLFASVCLVFAGTLHSAPCFGTDVSVVTSDGNTTRGRLLSVSAEQVAVYTGISSSGSNRESLVKIKTDQVVSIKVENPDEDTRGSHRIRLVDGSHISIDAFESKGNDISVRFLGNKVQMSRRNVDWVLFDANIRVDETLKRWAEIAARDLKEGDRLVVLRKENMDWLDGVIGDSDEEKTQFQLGDRKADVSRERIAGLIFYHASGRELVDPLCQVQTIEGSVFQTRSIKIEKEHFELTLVSGDIQKIPAKQVRLFDFASGRFAILSQMKPASVRWQPLLASTSTIDSLRALNLPRFNKSFNNDNLGLSVQTTGTSGIKSTSLQSFSNGWAARSGTRLVFNVDQKYKKITGKIGFSPTAGPAGNLKLTIRGDRKILLEREMKAEDKEIIDVSIEIEGVDRIIFEIDYLDGRSVGDELHFCDMKVSR